MSELLNGMFRIIVVPRYAVAVQKCEQFVPVFDKPLPERFGGFSFARETPEEVYDEIAKQIEWISGED